MTWIDKAHLNVLGTQTCKSDEEPTEKIKYYRVQVGAFANKENAEKMLKKINRSGFEGSIILD